MAAVQWQSKNDAVGKVVLGGRERQDVGGVARLLPVETAPGNSREGHQHSSTSG